ncbi:bifunctional transcriptional activator/DNA repair enzyme AdaA [Paenibacillus sp. KN14-4R]|uniref:bifunctional transcriptional activator/DNA repair enzyme AdaA n=1 Tax=Paenibacillus sp. KN14-4R TaxID=3445773 RepID=UPI003FA0B0F2
MIQDPISNDQWQAILNNDTSYDHTFIYAVQTTGIFCKPSCKSKAPLKDNVRIFKDSKEALDANFRPCKRCKPTGERLPNEEWAAQITHFIDMNYSEEITLELLADKCHGSPYHLHRTFKQVTGMTPTAYIQQVRVNKACEYLNHSKLSIADIAHAVGIANTPYFITLFKKKTGHTPAIYRQLQHNKLQREGLNHE